MKQTYGGYAIYITSKQVPSQAEPGFLDWVYTAKVKNKDGITLQTICAHYEGTAEARAQKWIDQLKAQQTPSN